MDRYALQVNAYTAIRDIARKKYSLDENAIIFRDNFIFNDDDIIIGSEVSLITIVDYKTIYKFLGTVNLLEEKDT
jgi:hypothetical protein